MRRIIISIFLVYSLIFFSKAYSSEKKRIVDASLIAQVSSIYPGQSFWVGVHLQMPEGWHTYWRNPGDSGEATKINWSLPDGFKVDEIMWPIPSKFNLGRIVNYGYAGQVVLPVQIHAAEVLTSDAPQKIGADVSWLVCKEICVSEEGSYSLELEINSDVGGVFEEENTDVFTQSLNNLPTQLPGRSFFKEVNEVIYLSFNGLPRSFYDAADIYVFPYDWGVINYNAEQEISFKEKGSFQLTVKRGDLGTKGKESLGGVLVIDDNGRRTGYEFFAKPAGSE